MRQKGLDIGPASEALLLSVCFAAVVSLDSDQLQSELGLEYHKAKQAYEIALDQALSRADFVKSPRILTLQASVLDLLCARVDGDTRLVWAESAVVIRLAQSQTSLNRSCPSFRLRKMASQTSLFAL